MDSKQAKIFAASLGAKMPELDLHGFYPDEALEELELFLFENKDKQMCRVIYGGGTGKLREVVLMSLTKHPMVEDVVEEGSSCVILN